MGKYILSFKENNSTLSESIKCNNCKWSWETDSNDDRKYLCHKCGWDNSLKKFDILSLRKWQKSNKF